MARIRLSAKRDQPLRRRADYTEVPNGRTVLFRRITRRTHETESRAAAQENIARYQASLESSRSTGAWNADVDGNQAAPPTNEEVLTDSSSSTVSLPEPEAWIQRAERWLALGVMSVISEIPQSMAEMEQDENEDEGRDPYDADDEKDPRETDSEEVTGLQLSAPEILSDSVSVTEEAEAEEDKVVENGVVDSNLSSP